LEHTEMRPCEAWSPLANTFCVSGAHWSGYATENWEIYACAICRHRPHRLGYAKPPPLSGEALAAFTSFTTPDCKTAPEQYFGWSKTPPPLSGGAQVPLHNIPSYNLLIEITSFLRY
jgi:hypothetical protein